ncbi:MAG: undecaprenyl/decaprenyl-phosphate alpha-N-acetylglucosaminyl 1-phosphate transferase [Candidatus Aminicenantes bacterium]|nr:undecaprenyl/decaprenyl-phosphate alpha-N-acetylglucosaminyl 1-phosphate transferase [Candidatus Aminicenantes bacterium]
MKIIFFFSIISASFFITFLTLKYILNYVERNNITTRTNVNQDQKELRSRFGGIGIFIGFLSPLVLISILSGSDIFALFKIYDISGFDFYYLSLFSIFLLGLIDDLIGLNAWQKLPPEIFIASLLFANGFAIKIISIPFSDSPLLLSLPVSYILTILWIVGITNAMNLIDGIDGLAGGIGLITSVSFLVISFLNQRPESSILSVSMIGALLAFMIYNLYPSRIYMGDSGSLLLGFFLATLSLKASSKASFGISFMVPIIILFIPIFDTGLSFLRRIMKKKNPLKPDKEHIHHMLMLKGNSEKKVFYIIMAWTMIFSILGVSSALIPKYYRIIMSGAVMVLGVILVYYLKYFKLRIFYKIFKLIKRKKI